MIVGVELSTMSECIVVLGTVVISGDDVCCSVVFDSLVGVFVFSVPKLLITCAISHQCTSSRECSERSYLR